MSSLHGMSRRFWFGVLHRKVDLVESANLHATLAEAIFLGNEKNTVTALDKLIDHIEKCTRETIDSEQ